MNDSILSVFYSHKNSFNCLAHLCHKTENMKIVSWLLTGGLLRLVQWSPGRADTSLKQRSVHRSPCSVLYEWVEEVTNRDAFRAVLHVNPVVAMVPDALNAEVVGAVDWVSKSSQRLNEETLWDITLSLQYEHPRVNPQAVQAVFLGQL